MKSNFIYCVHTSSDRPFSSLKKALQYCHNEYEQEKNKPQNGWVTLYYEIHKKRMDESDSNRNFHTMTYFFNHKQELVRKYNHRKSIKLDESVKEGTFWICRERRSEDVFVGLVRFIDENYAHVLRCDGPDINFVCVFAEEFIQPFDETVDYPICRGIQSTANNYWSSYSFYCYPKNFIEQLIEEAKREDENLPF